MQNALADQKRRYQVDTDCILLQEQRMKKIIVSPNLVLFGGSSSHRHGVFLLVVFKLVGLHAYVHFLRHTFMLDCNFFYASETNKTLFGTEAFLIH